GLTVQGGQVVVGATLSVQNDLTIAASQVSVAGAVTVGGLTRASAGSSLQLGALTSTGILTLDASSLQVDSVVAPQLTLSNASLLACAMARTTQVHLLDLDIAGTLNVDATSRIDVSGKGYLAGRTTGNTTTGGATGNAGGSYGGVGGAPRGTANAVYGT